MDLIRDVEQHRKDSGLSKTDMGRYFGIEDKPYQYYDNWVKRDSLPKKYHSKAKELLGIQEIKKTTVRAIKNDPSAKEAYELLQDIIDKGMSEKAAEYLRFLAHQSN